MLVVRFSRSSLVSRISVVLSVGVVPELPEDTVSRF